MSNDNAWTAFGTGGNALATVAGIGIGAGIGGPAGAAIGGAIGQGVGSLGQAISGLFRKPKVQGPSAEARISEAQLRHFTDTMSDSLTPTELSTIATRERADLAQVEQELMELSMNPNIAPTTTLKARNVASSGLANMFARQRGETAGAEIAARKARAEMKTQALASLAQVADANSRAIQQAEAMQQQLRQMQIAAVGENVASSGMAIAGAFKNKALAEQAAIKEEEDRKFKEALLMKAAGGTNV